jgi:antitoxin CptB
MDMIVGGFARQRLAFMTDAELQEFSGILEIPDQDLLSWATRQSHVPASATSPMLQAILEFEPETALKPGLK